MDNLSASFLSKRNKIFAVGARSIIEVSEIKSGTLTLASSASHLRPCLLLNPSSQVDPFSKIFYHFQTKNALSFGPFCIIYDTDKL
jgi:hypothetical protein